MLKVWNASPDLRHLRAGAARHLPGPLRGSSQSIHAFGDSTVGGPLLALIAVVVIGSAAADRLAPRRPSLPQADRVARLPRGGVPGQQPAARRAGGGDLLGHVLPADLRAVHGRQGLARRALVQPLHDAAGDPAGAVHRDRPAAGLAPGQRRRPEAAAGRSRRWSGLVAAVALFAFTDARSEPLALVLFSLAAFSLTALAQEFGRGAAGYRALVGGSYPRALLALFSRNRRRYGGYVVHAGLAVLLIAVAASSSFQTSRDLRLRPGQSATVDDYRVTYERADRGGRAGRATPHLRLGARGAKGRRALRDPSPVPQLLRRDGEPERRGADQELLRGRGDQRGGPQDDRRRATSGPRCSRTWRRSTRSSTGPTGA